MAEEEEPKFDEFTAIDNNNNEILNPNPNMEIVDPEKTIAMLKQRDSMASEMIADLRSSLEEGETKVESLEREIKSLKQSNAKSEMKVRELERKLFVSEMKEMEERSKRVRIEEKMREKVEERERKIEELEEREILKDWVVIGLRERVKESERAMKKIRGIKSMNREEEKEEEDEKGLNLQQWNSLGFAGAVSAVVAAVIYIWFGKRKSSSFSVIK